MLSGLPAACFFSCSGAEGEASLEKARALQVARARAGAVGGSSSAARALARQAERSAMCDL